MPTLTATAYPTEAYVLVQADWTDTPSVTHATVTRRNTVTGETVTLRPYTSYDSNGFLALSCGLGLWWDTEPPLNVELEYCTTAADVAVAVTTNCCFEVTAAPWSAVNGAVTRSSSFSHEGSFSLRLVTDVGAFTNVRAFNATVSPFTANPVTVSAWVFTDEGWRGAMLDVKVQYEDLLVETFASPVQILNVSEWAFFTFTFTPRLAGNITEIRLWQAGDPTTGVPIWIDEIQATQLQPVTATACDTVTVTSESVWLKSPLHPCSDVEVDLCTPMFNDCTSETQVSYAGTADEDRAANTVLLQPDNRPYPIPVNRQRRKVTSSLRLITHDCDARDTVLNINDPGDPLLFQAPAEYCIPDRYISVATLTESRFSVDQRDEFRLITLPYAEVERPVGPADAPCGIRIADLCDIYTSWQSMTLSGLTYEDLLLGMASHDSPTNPLPAAARTWGDVETEFVDWAAVEAGGTRDWGELRDGL